MTDLDRLLELARGVENAATDAEYQRTRSTLADACRPDTIIGLIERVKEAENAVVVLPNDYADLLERTTLTESKVKIAVDALEAINRYMAESGSDGHDHAVTTVHRALQQITDIEKGNG